MALYRQIAGTNVPGHVGLSLRDTLADMVAPIFEGSPNNGYPNTLQVTDTGAVSPITDPRDWDPNNQPAPDFTVSPLPTLTPSQPLQPGNETDGTTPTPLPTDTKTAIKNNLLPLAALAGVVLVAVKGDELLKKNRKIVFLGGLGLLYYGMTKNKLL